MTTEPIDVVFSFDTTGSMYPCLTQVRREVERTVGRLFDEIPNLRVGVIAHGDYCDRRDAYVTKTLALTEDRLAICRFIRDVGPTGGGDSAECYELVLHEARSLGWRPGKQKVLVLIGDDVPHSPSECARQGAERLDWRQELDLLLEAGIKVHAVQALRRSHATRFYEEVAERTGGFHLQLDQFSEVTALILAIGFQQLGPARLQGYQDEVQHHGRMSRSVADMFDRLGGKPSRARSAKSLLSSATTAAHSTELTAVPPSRFQVLFVDRDCAIDAFVREQGLRFAKGRGFYELTKAVKVQASKEVVLQHRRSGDFYSGSQARRLVGLPAGVDVQLSPVSLEDYRVFIQSTSANRKLLAETSFLYEVEDWRHGMGGLT